MDSVKSGVYDQDQDIEIYKEFDDMPMFETDDQNMVSLLRGITSYGFKEASPIQQRAIVPLYHGKNLISQSQSGTGKTGAFVIGSLSRLDPSLDKVQIVVISPTHELARQTYDVYKSLSYYMFPDEKSEKNSATLCIGQQVSIEDNIRSIKNGSKIVVGTPGRLFHIISHPNKLIDPKYCKVLIIDEADQLFASEDSRKLYDIVDILDDKNFRSDNLQLGIFSATFNSEESLETARRLCIPNYDDFEDWRTSVNAPKQILLQPDELTLEGIIQYYFDLGCTDQRRAFYEKAQFIVSLNSERMIPTCIIYVNNKDTAEQLKDFLTDNNMVCGCIYGSLPSYQRADITTKFRKNQIRILISTDLLARGFDVRQVSLVINFDLPYVYDRRNACNNEQKIADYLHRIGRSGRFGRKGVAINLIATSGDQTKKEIIEERYKTYMKELPDDVSEIY
jgi:translation initiation factor 4A